MRVFVAGATGALGRPLVPALLAAGHEVAAMSRSEVRAAELARLGATPVVCDVYEAEQLATEVARFRPAAVINHLTALPDRYTPRSARFYAATNRIRSEGGHNLLAAARAAGTVERFVTESIAFLYAPVGGPVKDEEDPAYEDAPPPFGEGVQTMVAHEREVLDSPQFAGLVLRYGQLYGPGTYYDRDGSIARQVRRRMLPIVGAGSGVTSFVHVEDAASATIAALERGEPGIYNIVDDEPAPFSEWLPVYAAALGAKPPRRIPVWVARLVAGGAVAATARELRGASNAKAKRLLGWEPRYPSWRQGFAAALG